MDRAADRTESAAAAAKLDRLEGQLQLVAEDHAKTQLSLAGLSDRQLLHHDAIAAQLVDHAHAASAGAVAHEERLLSAESQLGELQAALRARDTAESQAAKSPAASVAEIAAAQSEDRQELTELKARVSGVEQAAVGSVDEQRVAALEAELVRMEKVRATEQASAEKRELAAMAERNAELAEFRGEAANLAREQAATQIAQLQLQLAEEREARTALEQRVNSMPSAEELRAELLTERSARQELEEKVRSWIAKSNPAGATLSQPPPVSAARQGAKRRADEMEDDRRSSIAASAGMNTPSPGAAPVRICFSGFKKGNASYEPKDKDYLSCIARRFNAEIVDTPGQCTHLISPPGARTMKTIQALLSDSWVVSREWIDAGGAAKSPSDIKPQWGVRCEVNPFSQKRIGMTEMFRAESQGKKGGVPNRYENLMDIVTTAGARFIEESFQWPQRSIDFKLKPKNQA